MRVRLALRFPGMDGLRVGSWPINAQVFGNQSQFINLCPARENSLPKRLTAIFSNSFSLNPCFIHIWLALVSLHGKFWFWQLEGPNNFCFDHLYIKYSHSPLTYRLTQCGLYVKSLRANRPSRNDWGHLVYTENSFIFFQTLCHNSNLEEGRYFQDTHFQGNADIFKTGCTCLGSPVSLSCIWCHFPAKILHPVTLE